MPFARFVWLSIALFLVSAPVAAQTPPPPSASTPPGTNLPPVVQPGAPPRQPVVPNAPPPQQPEGPQAPSAPTAPSAPSPPGAPAPSGYPQQPYQQPYPQQQPYQQPYQQQPYQQPYPAQQQGYPTAPPVYYAPGYAPAYGQQQQPQPPQPQQPSYYGTEGPPADYPRQNYQAVQGRKPGPGSHEHEGLYLHLSTGIGAGGVAYKERYADGTRSSIRQRGIAATFDFGFGGRIVDNFILHGNLTFTAFDVGKKKVDGVEDNGFDSISTATFMLGAGGTYYFMPTNLYLTLVVGTGVYTETRDYGVSEEDIHSKAGFHSTFAIGKEWWVGGRGEWGIGAAIKGMFAVAPIEIAREESTLTAHAVTLQFSATLN